MLPPPGFTVPKLNGLFLSFALLIASLPAVAQVRIKDRLSPATKQNLARIFNRLPAAAAPDRRPRAMPG
jgi:hypothetical protein